MSNRIMRDSINVMSIPLAGTDIAAGYLDGTYDNETALIARFPHVPHNLIDVNGTRPDAQTRDWETGDKAGSLEQWVINHNNHTGKKDAVVYCNRSTIPEVRRLTASQILNKDYYLWVATLDGTVFTPNDLPGVIACQDKGSPQTHGNYDESLVFADWWLAPVIPPSVTHAQPNWKWCRKCQGLFYGTGLLESHCPRGGTHTDIGSGNYVLNWH